MQAISLIYRPDYADLFEASALVGRRRYTRGQHLRASLVLFGSMIAGGVLAVALGVGLNLWNRAIPVVPVTLAVFLLVALLYGKVLLPWQRRLLVTALAAASPTNDLTFTADHTGMRWRDDRFDIAVTWSGIEAVYATANSFAFMVGAIATVVPYAPFQTKRQSRLSWPGCLSACRLKRLSAAGLIGALWRCSRNTRPAMTQHGQDRQRNTICIGGCVHLLAEGPIGVRRDTFR